MENSGFLYLNDLSTQNPVTQLYEDLYFKQNYYLNISKDLKASDTVILVFNLNIFIYSRNSCS